MAKQTIIDWQKDSLLVTSCSGRGQNVKIDQLSLNAYADEAGSESANATQAVAKAASKLGLGKTDVTVVASREIVEVRTISVPRIEADELPDVIRFQAQRQLANMGDNWVLDYVMLPSLPEQEMQTALVGAISPARINAIETACTAAGLQVTRIVLKPIEIARYATQSGSLPAAGAGMLICISDKSADLLILKSGQLVLVRGTKLPSESGELPKLIDGEVRRSLMAASAQLGGEPVEKIVLFAAESLAAQVEQSIANAAGVSVTVVDPINLLSAKLESRADLALREANRLIAIAGASLYSLTDQKSSLDFKNPKKRPPKKKNTKLFLLAGAAAVLLVIAGASWWYSTNEYLDEELAYLQQEISAKEEVVNSSRKKIAELGEIEKFLNASPNFLDELTHVAQRIPDSERVILGGPTFSVLSDGRGQIRVPVAADSAGTISEFEESIRDENHSVKGSENRQSAQPTELYKWEAVETISIENRGWKLDMATSVPTGQADETDTAEESQATDEILESDEAPVIPDHAKPETSESSDDKSAA